MSDELRDKYKKVFETDVYSDLSVGSFKDGYVNELEQQLEAKTKECEELDAIITGLEKKNEILNGFFEPLRNRRGKIKGNSIDFILTDEMLDIEPTTDNSKGDV